jgi:uncharacterized membrane protein YkvA (DUF1232 family)
MKTKDPTVEIVPNENAQPITPKRMEFYEKLRAKFTSLAAQKLGTDGSKFTEYLLALPDFFILLCRLAADNRVKPSQKVLVGGIIAYVISPIDIIPDFIPVIGYIDDLVLVVFGLNIVLNELDNQVLVDNWSGQQDVLELMQKITAAAEGFLDRNILKRIKNWLNKLDEK